MEELRAAKRAKREAAAAAKASEGERARSAAAKADADASAAAAATAAAAASAAASASATAAGDDASRLAAARGRVHAARAAVEGELMSKQEAKGKLRGEAAAILSRADALAAEARALQALLDDGSDGDV